MLQDLLCLISQLGLVSAVLLLVLTYSDGKLLALLLVYHTVCEQFGEPRACALHFTLGLALLRIDLWDEVWRLVLFELLDVVPFLLLILFVALIKAHLVDLFLILLSFVIV